MKYFCLRPAYLPFCGGMLGLALWTVAGGTQWTSLRADEPTPLPTNQSGGQQSFTTPDEAANALRTAAESGDQAALTAIFGPDYKSLATGDAEQDARNARRFAIEIRQSCRQVNNEDNSITLEVGTNGWPMPIPLVKVAGQWQFDTAAGKEEIINRHIGKDELHAIGACRAYVLAQKQHAVADPQGRYALQFVSTEGTHDGLYWPATMNEPPSPFGPRLAEAQRGAHDGDRDQGSKPFHGYFFKILTCQGPDALGGKMEYVHHGRMTGGFALLAYPEHWDESGIMTFIVSQDGRVYQRNLGAETKRLVRRIKEYNPDATWTLVLEDGVITAALEQ